MYKLHKLKVMEHFEYRILEVIVRLNAGRQVLRFKTTFKPVVSKVLCIERLLSLRQNSC